MYCINVWGYIKTIILLVHAVLIETYFRHQIRPPRFSKNEDQTPINPLTRAITCFDFSKHNPEMFIVGAEGGMIIHCSVLGAAKLPSNTSDVPILDSAITYYNKLQGEVTAVSFSPNRKDMFMTCSTSAEIRIYIVDQVSVILIQIHNLVTLNFL